MKKAITIFVFFSFSVFLKAQQIHPDSLRQQISVTTNDTLLMYYYQQLGLFYASRNIDSANYYLDLALPLARNLRQRQWEAISLMLKGDFLKIKRNYLEAWRLISQALKIAEDPESEKYVFFPSNMIKPTPHQFRLQLLGRIHGSLADLNWTVGDTTKRRIEVLKAKVVFEEINSEFDLTGIYSLLANIYLEQNKLDSALYYIQKAMDMSLKITGRIDMYTFSVAGNIYARKSDKKKARQYFYAAIKEGKNYPFQGNVYNQLAALLKEEGELDSSLYYAYISKEILEKSNNLSALERTYNTLASVYKLLNNVDSAFKYLQLQTAAKDSLDETGNLKKYLYISFEEQLRSQELEKERIEYRGKVKTNTMLAGIGGLMLFSVILYRNFRQRKKAAVKIENAYNKLKDTQKQLIQSEKMASLGELTAGIAHEIQNPLNFVNNFSDVNKELLEELKIEANNGNLDEIKAIATNVIANEEKINHHGKRADAIVKGMLQHSRISSGVKDPTDINALCEEYLRLAFHGLRAKDKSFNSELKTDFDNSIGKINLVPQDIGRVVLNLINNAFYAVHEKKKLSADSYEPLVKVSTHRSGDKIEIKVSDNGNGIPESIKEKIFQPFFTTKPTGQGTGLGLSLSYDIIKAHGGTISAISREGEGTEFIIQLTDHQQL